MYCINCGKEIEEGAEFCSHCGNSQRRDTKATEAVSEVPRQENGVSAPKKMNTLAIVGFVIAMISLFLNFWGLVGIAAVIVSVIGMIKVKENNENGKGFALAGIIVGACSVLYGFAMIL